MRIQNPEGERQGNGSEEGMKGAISTTLWRNWWSKTQWNIKIIMMRMSHADFQRIYLPVLCKRLLSFRDCGSLYRRFKTSQRHFALFQLIYLARLPFWFLCFVRLRCFSFPCCSVDLYFKIVWRVIDLHCRISWSKYYRPDELQPHTKLSCFATVFS